MWEQHQCSPGMGKIRERLIGRDVYERKNLLGNRDCLVSFRFSWPKTEFGIYVYSALKYNSKHLFYWVVFPNKIPALTWQSVQWRSMGTSQKPWSHQWEAELWTKSDQPAAPEPAVCLQSPPCRRAAPDTAANWVRTTRETHRSIKRLGRWSMKKVILLMRDYTDLLKLVHVKHLFGKW